MYVVCVCVCVREKLEPSLPVDAHRQHRRDTVSNREEVGESGVYRKGQQGNGQPRERQQQQQQEEEEKVGRAICQPDNGGGDRTADPIGGPQPVGRPEAGDDRRRSVTRR